MFSCTAVPLRIREHEPFASYAHIPMGSMRSRLHELKGICALIPSFVQGRCWNGTAEWGRGEGSRLDRRPGRYRREALARVSCVRVDGAAGGLSGAAAAIAAEEVGGRPAR